MEKSKAYQDALEHIMKHANLHKETQERVNRLNKNQGNAEFSIRMLTNYTEANAMISWVRDNDLILFKSWSYISAKLGRILFQFNPYEWFPAYKFFSALLCDNKEIINWYSKNRISYDSRQDLIKERDNPKRPDFHGYQMILALNHEWDRLRSRCEQILSLELKKDRKYLIDHRFYLALANGDKIEMENILRELTSPKIAKTRNYGFAFTFTEHFIATHATIYAKLAWLNGYQVEIDTPCIPKEWLPINPLEEYPEPWEFLKNFDIWKPFDDENIIRWSPQNIA